MKITSCELENVSGLSSQYPKGDFVEIALSGRSNVGKSSFVNNLLQRKNIARTSSKPGKTRTINFYKINDSFRLVDLPGYGYAKASKTDMEKWADLINDYLETREQLKEIFLIVDSRHEPTSQDLEMYEWIKHAGFTGYIIATKIDKIGKSKIDQSKKTIAKKLNADRNLIIPYSSTDGYGRKEVLDLIGEIIE